MNYKIRITSGDKLDDVIDFNINMIGEGIVWSPIDNISSELIFKTKGDDHKVSKTQDKVPVDVERVNSLNALVDVVLGEGRLEQGLAYLKEENIPLEKSSVPHFMKWINADIEKEELDTITDNGFTMKDVNKPISEKARKWYFNQLDSLVGL
tara:strand:- start:23488 stop:23943 length:456 start_codon:yes stop_codon:yes gene_type:complete